MDTQMAVPKKTMSGCFICEESLSDGETITLKERGLKTLRECSAKRRDNKKTQLEGLKCVTVHVKCQKSYTKDSNVVAALKSGSEPNHGSRTLRSESHQFDFKTNCIFCGENASEDFFKKEAKKPITKRDTVHRVATLKFKQKLIETSNKRSDSWASAVTLRVSNVNDLVAVEGRYHNSCMGKYYKIPSSSNRQAGRPEDKDVTAAFEHVCSYIELNRDKCQITLRETLKDFKGYIPTDKTLKKKLLNKYGHDIIITARQSKEPTISFRDTGYEILTKNFYESRNSNEQQEHLRIVRAAADIIGEDIRSKIYNTDSNLLSDAFFDNEVNVIPETLSILLDSIIMKNKCENEDSWRAKCMSIAHAVVTATRAKSFTSSLQVVLDKDIDIILKDKSGRLDMEDLQYQTSSPKRRKLK